MFSLVVLSVLSSAPSVHGELTTHSAFSVGELFGGMQAFGGRLEVHFEDVRLVAEVWARPVNVTLWVLNGDAGDGQLSTRVVGGHLSGGLDGELRPTRYWDPSGEWSTQPVFVFSVGPSFGVSFGDDRLRFEARVAWLTMSRTPDPTRVTATAELTWRVLQVRLMGGTNQIGLLRSATPPLYPHLTAMVGLRFRW